MPFQGFGFIFILKFEFEKTLKIYRHFVFFARGGFRVLRSRLFPLGIMICLWNVFSSPSLKPPAAKIQLFLILAYFLTRSPKKMNFSDCSKSRFDSLERKFRSFAAILAKNRRITCIMRRVMSISFRDLNLGPNVVYYFLIHQESSQVNRSKYTLSKT